METNNVSKQILVEILQIKKSFKNPYEQKCFIIGMTHILSVHDAPESFRDPSTTSRLLQEILIMLEKVKKTEAKGASKKAAKQINADDDDSSSEDSMEYDEDTSSDEEGTDTLNQNGKRSSGNSVTAEEMMDDESKEEKK